LAVRGVRKMGLSPCSLALRGDSVAALSWVERQTFSGELVGNAATVFIIQGLITGISVDQTDHLPEEENWRADFLSRNGTGRGGSWAELQGLDDGLTAVNELKLDETGIIELCNPAMRHDDQSFWLWHGAIKKAVLS